MKKTTLFVLFFLFILNACEIERPNYPLGDENPEIGGEYRESYYGNFSFTVISESWNMNVDTITIDTQYYDGVIREYLVEDSEDDLYVDVEDNNYQDYEKITIEFLSYRKITSALSEDGILEPKSGYHYCHSGSFTHLDTIEFSITGLGGLGGGGSYYVTGVRR